MKLLKTLLLSLTLACGLMVSGAVLTGCTTPATSAYKVTSGTYTTVNAAMTAWGDYVAAYKPGADAERRVAQAYKTWQVASVAVVDAARAAQASDDTGKAKVEAAVASASAALGGLITILQQFGINLSIP